MTRTQEFIKAYSSKLEASAEFYNNDSSLSKPSAFKSAKFRFLLVFPSPAQAKAVSSTAAVINDFFKTYHQDVFFDVAWLPSDRDIRHYDLNSMPYAISSIAHLDPSHFDLVGFSVSILHEMVTIPTMMKSFSRCDKPIPLSWTERKTMFINEVPMIFSGGITSPHTDILYGHFGDDQNRQAFLDGMLLGTEEPIWEVIENIIKGKAANTTVQDVIDDCLSIPAFYHPQGYEVIYKDNVIVSNIKINPKCPDQVIPEYEKPFEKRLYTARTIVNGSGENASTAQYLMSEGAVAKGTPVRTNRGFIPIEEITTADTTPLHKSPWEIKKSWSLGYKKTRTLTTKSGRVLTLTHNHPTHQFRAFKFEQFVEAQTLRKGDFLTLQQTDIPQTINLSESEIHLQGFRLATNYGADSLAKDTLAFDNAQFLTFLKGFHDSMGIWKDDKVIFPHPSEEIIREIQMFAAHLGIFGEIYNDSSNWYFRVYTYCIKHLSNFYEHQPVKNSFDQDIIPVTKDALSSFTRVAKREGHPDLVNQPLTRSNYSMLGEDVIYHFDEIVSIQETEAEVFDLTVGVMERYIANAILVHNCTGNGNCSFKVAKGTRLQTSMGVLPIETLVDFKQVQGKEMESFSRVVKQSDSEVTQVTTESGRQLDCDKDHIWLVLKDDKLVETLTKNLKYGNTIFRKLGASFTPKEPDTVATFNLASEQGTKANAKAQVPEYLFQANRATIAEYFRHFYNNKANDTNQGITLRVQSLKFAQDLSQLWNILNINVNITRSRSYQTTTDSTAEHYWIITIPYITDFSVASVFGNSIFDFQALAHEVNQRHSSTTTIPLSTEFAYKVETAIPHSVSDAGHISAHTLRKYYSNHKIPHDLRLLLFDEFIVDTIKSAVETGKVSEMYDVANTASTWCVYNDLLTHNCFEGWYAGAWKENPKDNIVWASVESRKYNAARAIKSLSFNTNHHSDFKGILYDLRTHFKQVKFNNMRLNELAKDYDQWKMMSYLGQTHFAAPIEGISDRIRNGIMNKHLDPESVDFMFDQLIGQSLSDIKIGVIMTGYENDEDWQELYATFDKVTEKVRHYNKKYPARIKITGLVHYPSTPFAVTEKIMARKAFSKERFLTNDRYNQNKEHNIHVKFNGFIGSTFVEQALIDLGRSLTPWLYRNIVVKNHVCYALNSVIKDRAFDDLKTEILSDTFFAAKDIDNDYISPMHRIRISLMGALVNTSRHVINHTATDHEGSDTTGKCLYTFEGAKTVCASKSLKVNYIEYGDVKVIHTENGPHKEGQELNRLSGCDYCKSGKEKVTKHLKRKIRNKDYSVDDLKAQYLGADFTKYRLIIQRKSGGFKELNPANTAHLAVAALLRHSDKLLHNFWEIVAYSNQRQVNPNKIPFNVSGRQIIDFTVKDSLLNEIKKAIPLANADLTTLTIKGVSTVAMTDTLKADDLELYRFSTSLSASNIAQDVAGYAQEIQVFKMDLFEKVIDPTLTKPVLGTKNGQTVGYFTLPLKYNPLVYFSSMLKHKTLTKNDVRIMFDIQALDVLRESSLTCRCGAPAMMSLSSGKVFTCKTCAIKQLLQRETK